MNWKFIIALLLIAAVAVTFAAKNNGRDDDDDDDDDRNGKNGGNGNNGRRDDNDDDDDDDDDDNGYGSGRLGKRSRGWPDSSNLRVVGVRNWGKSDSRSTGPAYYYGLRNGGRGNNNRYYG